MRISRIIVPLVIVVIVIITGSISLGEEIMRPIDVDNRKWVDLYAEYITKNYDDLCDGYTYPRVILLDLDIDAIPELIVLGESSVWSNGGHIIKITDAGVIDYYDPALLSSSFTLALAVDGQGNYSWYEKTFSAHMGTTSTNVYKLTINSNMALESEMWFSYGMEESEGEDTGLIKMVKSGHSVYGNHVDYATYLKEEIKKRQLRVIYSISDGYLYPDDWEKAITDYCVFNIAG